MGVAQALGIGSAGEGLPSDGRQAAAASVGETALAAVVRRGMFRSHGRIVTLCEYICLVTERYIACEWLWKMFRMAELSVRIGSGAGWGGGGD